jgi:short-subunit dehydrogenase
MENLLNFKKQYGPWALISGASSGIGRELAKKTAELGLNTILVARRESRLSELAAEIGERFDIETRIVSVDLSQDNFLEKIEEATEGLEVGLLINNAAADPGIMGDFVDNELSYELSTLNVNCRAPLMLTHVEHDSRRAYVEQLLCHQSL